MVIYNAMPTGERTTYSTYFDESVVVKWKALGDYKENNLGHNLSFEELCSEAKEADVLITGWGQIPFTKEVVDALPNLKLIAHTGGTVAPLITDSAVYDRGIRVLSGNDLFGKTIAEGCLCYTLSSLRKMEQYLGEVRETGWRQSPWRTKGLFGKKVGLVSFGVIAKHFTRMLKVFDITPLVYSGHMTEEEAKEQGVILASLEEIFATCDIVSVHSARTPKTIGMINEKLINSLKPGALFMNTARGEVVDEVALIKRLKKGDIDAVLDVYTDELGYESGEIENPYKELKNVIPMPHLAGAIDFRKIIASELADDVLRYQKGEKMENEVLQEALARMTR